VADLEVKAIFSAVTAGAIANLKSLETAAKGVDSSLQNAGGGSGGLSKFLGGFGRLATIGVGALGAMGAAAGMMGIKTAAANEQALISFETLLGSAGKAKKMFDDLNKFAASTPFEFPQLRDAASKLLTTGVAADRVIPIMTALGDATSAMGTGAEGIGRAVYALQQMNTAGKVTGQDMMQLASSGVPIWDALAASIGKSVPEVRKLASDGALVANDVMTAIETYAGPAMTRVKGMMAVQSQSMMGLMSTLKDTISIELGKMMQPAAEGLKKMLPELIKMVGTTLTAIGPTINTLVLNIFTLFQQLLPLMTPVMIAVGNLIAVGMSIAQGAIEAVMPYVPQIATFMKSLGDVVTNLVPIFQRLAAIFLAAVIPAISLTVEIAAKLSGFLAEHKGLMDALVPVIALIAGGFIAYKAAMGAIDLGKFIVQTGTKIATMWGEVTALGALIVEQGLLNTVTAMFPGTMIVLAIAAVIAAAILLWKNWDTVVNALKKAWNWLVDIVQKGINLILRYYEWWINRVIDGVNLIIKAWNKLPFHKDVPTLDHVNYQIDLSAAKLKTVAANAGAASLAFGASADSAQRMADKTAIAAHAQQVAIAAMYKAAGVTGGFGATAPSTGNTDTNPKPPGTGGGTNKVLDAAQKRIDALTTSIGKVKDATLSFQGVMQDSFDSALGRTFVFNAGKAREEISALSSSIAGAKTVTPKLVEQYKDLTKAIGDQFATAIGNATKLLDNAKTAFADFSKTVSDAVTKTMSFSDSFSKGESATKAFVDSQKASSDALINSTASIDKVTLAEKNLLKVRDQVLAKSTESIDQVALAEKNLVKTRAKARVTDDEIAAAEKDVADAKTNVATVSLAGAEDIANAEKEIADAKLDSAKAAKDLKTAQDEEAKASIESQKTFVDRLKEQALAGKTFADDIKKLIAMGLGQSALQQVLAAGTTAGTKIADELILGGVTAINETNDLLTSVEAAAAEVALIGATKWYQAGIDQATAQVQGLVDQMRALTPSIMAIMDDLADKMEREVKIKLKVEGTKVDWGDFNLDDLINGMDTAIGDATKTATTVTTGSKGPTGLGTGTTLSGGVINGDVLANIDWDQLSKDLLNIPGIATGADSLDDFMARASTWTESMFAGWEGALMMANGGVVNSPTLAMVGEAGPEAVIPLDRFGQMQGGGDTVINLNIEAGFGAGGKDIGDAIVNELIRYQRRNGKIPVKTL